MSHIRKVEICNPCPIITERELCAPDGTPVFLILARDCQTLEVLTSRIEDVYGSGLLQYAVSDLVECDCVTEQTLVPNLTRTTYGRSIFGINGREKLSIAEDYDSVADDEGCPQGPIREISFEIISLTVDGSVVVSNEVVGPYPLGTTLDTIAQDINSVIAPHGSYLTYTGNPTQQSIAWSVNNTVDYELRIRDGFSDQLGGVCWSTNTSWIFRYDATTDVMEDAYDFQGLVNFLPMT